MLISVQDDKLQVFLFNKFILGGIAESDNAAYYDR